mgnify:CR=1 FL=1
MPYSRCDHDMRSIHQISYDAFECRICGMIFFGIDRDDPRQKPAIEHMRQGRTIDPDIYLGDPRHMHSGQTYAYVDLGTIPQDIIDTKDQLKEMEKALSVFVEVLKSAIQS